MNDGIKKPGFNLVWTAKDLQEADWIRFLLGPMIRREVFADDFSFVEPDSIYVVATNQSLPQCLPRKFLAQLATVKGKGIVHLADEYYGGGYALYAEFDFVLRTYYSSWFDNHHGILMFPLGWANGTPLRSGVKPAATRKYLWSFLGNQKAASRPEMFKALRPVKPNFVHGYQSGMSGSQKLSRLEYAAVLDETVFAPCPMGNANLETWRFYEALEAGCIPIIEGRPWLRYYERLLGPLPVPMVYRWSQSADLIKGLALEPERLNRVQRDVSEWWSGYKQRERERVADFICKGFQRGAGGVSKTRMQSTLPVWKVRRMIELLRHQSLMCVLRRLNRVVSRTGAQP
jgi:hypothetical protein